MTTKLPKYQRGQVVGQPRYSGSGGCMGQHTSMILEVRPGWESPFEYRLEDPLIPSEEWAEEDDLEPFDPEEWKARQKIRAHLKERGIDL